MESLRSVVLNGQNTLFDVRCWAFDAYSQPPVGSTFISFFSLIRLAVFLARGHALMKLQMFGTVGRATVPAETGRHGGRPYDSKSESF